MAVSRPTWVALGLALVLSGAGAYSLKFVRSPGSAESDLKPPDAAACRQVLIGLAAGVLGDDDQMVRRYVHRELLAQLPVDRPLSAQLREILPDAPVLLRFDEARFTADPPVLLASPGRVRIAVHAELGGDARFETTLLLGADDGRWKLLGMAQ